ncbi:MAG: hypothetical protein QME21_03350 [Anaerolineales bacterium]|nr:hypothetical protein [Anaerolineales bacterium]
MSGRRVVIWIIANLFIVLLLTRALPARAQEISPEPESDANCVACHEHQYYLYDSGKWFCLCDAPMHCVYCHGGRTDSMIKEIAHEGLVLYPTQDHAARCQSCHSEDYMSRVVTFATVAGISSTPRALVTATPVKPVATIGKQPAPMLLRFSQLEPWRLVGLGFLAVVLVGVVIFGYRCWKADCLARLQS